MEPELHKGNQVDETPDGEHFAPHSLLVTEQMAAHTRARPALKRVHVVINPAAGQDQAVLKILNRVFHHAEIDWTVSITHRPGDATRQAREGG